MINVYDTCNVFMFNTSNPTRSVSGYSALIPFLMSNALPQDFLVELVELLSNKMDTMNKVSQRCCLLLAG